MRRVLVRELAYLLCAAAIGAPLWFYFSVFRPHQQHLKWYREVEGCIIRLADQQPDGLNQAQWAGCVFWTWQLHTNWGPAFREPAASRFLADFDRRLDGEVDLATIDWVWDQYDRGTPGGGRYSDRYRPTTPEKLKEAAESPHGEHALERWRANMRGYMSRYDR